VIVLWYPHVRCIGGVCLGATRDEVLSLGGYIEDEGDGSDDRYLKRFFPDLSAALSDGIVVSIAVSDECFLDRVNLIGLSLESAIQRIGEAFEQTEDGEVHIYQSSSGLELYVRGGSVSRVVLSDWSLVQG
jgi:hypothetical protein